MSNDAAPPAMTIRVLYSCRTCHLEKVGCDVPARGEEDVLVWMEATIAHVSVDHARRSPGCVPADGKLNELWIPTAGTDRVGGPPVQ